MVDKNDLDLDSLKSRIEKLREYLWLTEAQGPQNEFS